MYDNEAVTQYLHGFIDRRRSTVAMPPAADAEAYGRSTKDHGVAAVRMSLAQAVRKWEAQRAELSVGPREGES
jgi:hypothetical protein